MLSLNFPQSPKSRKFQSLTKLASPGVSPANSPKKEIFSLVDDAKLNESPQIKARPMSTLDAIQMIHDFNDKDQIRDAIESASTVKDRLQIIDMILEKREEIKENQYKIKLKHSSATIKKLTDIIISKVKKNQSRESVIAPKDKLLAVPSPKLSRSHRSSSSHIDSSTAITPNESASSRKNLLSPVLKKFAFVDRESPETHLPDKLESPSLVPKSQTQSSIIPGLKHTKTLSVNQSLRSLIENPPSLSKNGLQSPKKTEEIGRKIMLLQSQKSMDLKKTGWSMLLDQIMAKPNAEVTEPKKSEPIPKNQRVRGRTFTYSLAKTKLEHELLNYLLKYQGDDYKNIVLETGKPKQAVIRDIETKARSRFDSMDEVKVHPCTTSSPRKSTITNRQTPPSPIDIDKLFQNKEVKYKRKSNLRTASLYDIKTPKKIAILTQASDDFIGELDESYASYTEVKLDNLYKQTNIISQHVKDIQNKSEYQEILVNSKIGKSYSIQMKNLYENSEEVIKLTKKKLLV